MKKTLLAVVLVLPLLSVAQDGPRPPAKPVDSLEYYEKEFNRYWKQAMDSIKQTEQYKMLDKQVNIHRARSHNYSGVVLLADIMHSDFDEFNKSIATSGFPALSALTARAGFGMSTKSRWLMFDYYFGILGFNHRTSKGDEKITTSLSNLFQFDLGVDLLSSDVVSLYPYAGLSFRAASLSYSKPATTNPGYTNISNIILSDQSVSRSSLRLGYQAGLGLDFAFYRPKTNLAKNIFFVKAGTNGPVWTDSYKIHGVKYKPGIRHADWLISFGVKFTTRE